LQLGLLLPKPPPGGNVPAPLNVGPTGQTKDANLVLNLLNVSANGLLVPFGNVGIGTANPQSRLQVDNGYIQLDLTAGAPPATDCDTAAERGRMITNNVAGILYICVDLGWMALSEPVYSYGQGTYYSYGQGTYYSYGESAYYSYGQGTYIPPAKTCTLVFSTWKYAINAGCASYCSPFTSSATCTIEETVGGGWGGASVYNFAACSDAAPVVSSGVLCQPPGTATCTCF